MGLQSLPELTEAEKKIAEQVAFSLKLNHKGKSTSISNSKMVEAFKKIGLKISDTTIRKFINYLRHKGDPICSDSTGYWWAATQTELQSCINALQERLDAQAATLTQLKSILEKWKTQ